MGKEEVKRTSTCVSAYGGNLVMILVRNFMVPGRGDDFVLSMNELGIGGYGTLLISLNNDEYSRAVNVADSDDVELLGVEDTESGSPYVFVKRVIRNGKAYLFPVILNAKLAETRPCEDSHLYEEDYEVLGSNSFTLRLSSELDPEHLCAMRIIYAPGERIEWNEDDVERVFARI